MVIVLRIGGSIIASPINPELIRKYAELLEDLGKKGQKVIAVVGGGTLAREFIKVGKQLGLTEEAQDWLAIEVSHLYTLLFNLKLNENGIEYASMSMDEVLKALKRRNIVVLGGLKPGMTTDTVAALVAQKVGAQLLVKATDQEGIYTKDPRKHRDAKKQDTIIYKDLALLPSQNRHKAGIHQILDPIAIRILQETKTKTVIVDGFNPENIQRAINGEKIGTTIAD